MTLIKPGPVVQIILSLCKLPVRQRGMLELSWPVVIQSSSGPRPGLITWQKKQHTRRQKRTFLSSERFEFRPNDLTLRATRQRSGSTSFRILSTKRRRQISGLGSGQHPVPRGSRPCRRALCPWPRIMSLIRVWHKRLPEVFRLLAVGIHNITGLFLIR